MTLNREKVMRVVKESKDHPTAKMIFGRVAKENLDVSFATVYNSIKFLLGKGYIKKVLQIGDNARFDGRMDPHGHLTCESCETMQDFELGELTRLQSMQIPFGFQGKDVCVSVMGLCSECVSMANSTEGNLKPREEMGSSKYVLS